MTPRRIGAPNLSAAQAFAAALRRHGVELAVRPVDPVAHPPGRAGARASAQIAYRTENAGGAMADGYARIVRPRRRGHGAERPGGDAAGAGAGRGAEGVDPRGRAGAGRHARQLRPQRLPGARPPGSSSAAARSGCAASTSRDRIDDYVDMAFTAAASGRPGPAVLLLPADLLIERAAAPSRSGRGARARPLSARPHRRRSGAGRARRPTLLAEAERPLVVAGGGVQLSDAAAELAALQQDGRTCRSPPRAWARARSTRAIRCRSAWSATSWGRGGMARHQRAADRRRRRGAAGRQPHQPERHRLLDAASATARASSISTSTPGDRPQLRGAASGRRRQADAGGAARGAAGARPRAAPRPPRAALERRSPRARRATRPRLRRCCESDARADPARAADGASSRRI